MRESTRRAQWLLQNFKRDDQRMWILFMKTENYGDKLISEEGQK